MAIVSINQNKRNIELLPEEGLHISAKKQVIIQAWRQHYLPKAEDRQVTYALLSEPLLRLAF